MMHFFRHVTTFKTLARKATVALVLCAVLSTSYAVQIPRAEAQYSVVVVGGQGTVAQTMTAAATQAIAGLQQSLVAKEFVLDGILFSIAKMALQQIVQSTVRWINSGFQGSPAFVTDLEGFLLQAADEVIGEFIYGSDLDFLCSPFEMNVRLALEYSERAYRDQIQCTLSDVVGNVDQFLAGDFLQGGWQGWLELTTVPTNNPFGAYASAEARLAELKMERRTIDLNKLLWGDGFLGWEECEDIPNSNESYCTTMTPGRVIADALTFDLSVGKRTLIEADEFNEIISALFSQLANQALQGAGGLLGLTQTGGSYGNTSYIDRIGNPEFDTTPSTPGGGSGATSGPEMLAAAIADEESYRALYAPVVTRADEVVGNVSNDTHGCASSFGLVARAQSIRNQAVQAQSSADANLVQLRALQAQYAGASLEEEQALMEAFLLLRTENVLHTSVSAALDRYTTDGLMGELGNMMNQYNQCIADFDNDGGGD